MKSAVLHYLYTPAAQLPAWHMCKRGQHDALHHTVPVTEATTSCKLPTPNPYTLPAVTYVRSQPILGSTGHTLCGTAAFDQKKTSMMPGTSAHAKPHALVPYTAPLTAWLQIQTPCPCARACSKSTMAPSSMAQTQPQQPGATRTRTAPGEAVSINMLQTSGRAARSHSGCADMLCKCSPTAAMALHVPHASTSPNQLLPC